MNPVKKTNVFASKVERFTDNKKTSDLSPGPGTYSVNRNNWERKTKTVTMRSDNSPPVARPLNPPSIPSHNNVFGYEETLEKNLVRQNNPESGFSGEKMDTVGPG